MFCNHSVASSQHETGSEPGKQPLCISAPVEALANAACLSHPVLDAPIYIMTNASDMAMGATLQQAAHVSWQPLAFFSKKLQPYERKYSTFDRELLECTWQSNTSGIFWGQRVSCAARPQAMDAWSEVTCWQVYALTGVPSWFYLTVHNRPDTTKEVKTLQQTHCCGLENFISLSSPFSLLISKPWLSLNRITRSLTN